MMKALSITISSPGLPEKFPPPLKKLSRNNVGSSKSLRSSPIFYRRNAAGMINTAQEPYSPRVTCIGQVRARKSGAAAVSRRSGRCWFLTGKFLPRFRRFMCKWVVFFKACYCKKVDIGRKIEFLSGNCENSINVEVRVGDSCCSDPPPRNALMLTRFGRPSSLGERIWREKAGGNDGVAESRVGQESGGDLEKLRNINVGDLEGTSVTRCKSEPARRGEIKV